MGQGPRDWNPPGYWDEPSASVSTRSFRAYASTKPMARASNVIGLLAVALGLFATLLPLAHPDASTGFRGFAFTTAGVTAVMLAMRAAHLRREGRATSRLLPLAGGILGVTGTFLSLWSLAFYYAPNVIPPMPSLTSLTEIAQPFLNTSDGSVSPEVGSTAQKVIPSSVALVPLESAVLSPEETQSAMQMTAGTVAYVLKSLRLPGDPWPSALYIDAENMVMTEEGDELALLPAGTTATYTRSTSGENYRLTIASDLTGTGVTFDTQSGVVTNN